MNTLFSIDKEYKKITLYPTYESVHALLAEIHLYVFGADGGLIASQAVRGGKSKIALADEEMGNLRIVVAPLIEDDRDEALTLEAARKHGVFETGLLIEETQSSYKLPPVPEEVWRRWLLRSLASKVPEISGRKSGFLIW